MGNIMMVRRNINKVKVMKIDGDIFRLKTPVKASDVTKDYPGLVLLDSEAVKRLGVRAKPLEPNQNLIPNKTYFLVDLPSPNKLPYRRVMSGIHVGAKERLEMLMLSRKTVSDVGATRSDIEDGHEPCQRRVRVRLPRSQIKKLLGESHDDSEVAARIISCYLESSGDIQGGRDDDVLHRKRGIEKMKSLYKAREKHVSFAERGGGGEITVS